MNVRYLRNFRHVYESAAFAQFSRVEGRVHGAASLITDLYQKSDPPVQLASLSVVAVTVSIRHEGN